MIVKRDNFFSRKRVILLTIVFTSFIMMTPGIAVAASSVHSASNAYKYDGMTISIMGSEAQVVLNDQVLYVSWVIDKITSTGIAAMNIQPFSVERVNDTHQNSVILILRGTDLKVAEIFSFENQGYIDASISLENTGNVTSSYTATFLTHAPRTGQLYSSGFRGNYYNTPYSTNSTVYSIASGSWSASTGDVTVSWANEVSLFHAGAMEATPSNDIICIPFGPVTLVNSQTYFIDPEITPVYSQARTLLTSNNVANKPLVRCCLPCSDCGGGGGTPAASINNVTLSPLPFALYQPVTIYTTVDTHGLTATLEFEVQDLSRIQVIHTQSITSSSSTMYSYSFEAVRNYTLVQIQVSDSSGLSTRNNGVSELQWSPSTLSVPIDDSNGDYVGQLIMGTEFGETNNTLQYVNENTNGLPGTYADFSTVVTNGSNTEDNYGTIGVWSITQTVGSSQYPQGVDTFGSVSGAAPSNPWTFGTSGSAIEESQSTSTASNANSAYFALLWYVLGIVNSYVHNLIPSPGEFSVAAPTPGSYVSPSFTFPTISGTGTGLSYIGLNYQYDNPTTQISQPAWSFGVQTTDVINAAGQNWWTLVMPYTSAVTVTIMQPTNPLSLTFVSTSATLYTQLQVYPNLGN